jgi:hypothetical protein
MLGILYFIFYKLNNKHPKGEDLKKLLTLTSIVCIGAVMVLLAAEVAA